MEKELLSITAIILTIGAFVPYIRSIREGKTKPHVFTWIIWGSATFIVFLAQLAGNGGVGAWPTGVSGVITAYVAFLAYHKGADSIATRSDWCFFIAAMASLPLWYLTSDPLWAVVILTAVDLIGFIPTFRKAYMQPFGEKLSFFVLLAIRNVFAIGALEHYSLVTLLFPAMVALSCVGFIAMVVHRRGILVR